MHLHTSTCPSMHLPTPLHTLLCTSAHLSVASVHHNTPLYTPLQTYAFQHISMYFCPPLCTSCAPPCTSTHPFMHLYAPCIPLCTLHTSVQPLCSSVHLQQPLCTPICAPLHTSIHLCAPQYTPVHKSHWIKELPQPIRSLALNILIDIKSWFTPPPHHLLKSLHAARIDQLSDSNEPATIFVVSILESMV